MQTAHELEQAEIAAAQAAADALEPSNDELLGILPEDAEGGTELSQRRHGSSQKDANCSSERASSNSSCTSCCRRFGTLKRRATRDTTRGRRGRDRTISKASWQQALVKQNIEKSIVALAKEAIHVSATPTRLEDSERSEERRVGKECLE